LTIQLSKLPYDPGALEPHISAETMSYHYDRHHRGYVKKLNELIEGTPLENESLEDIILRARATGDIGILNNAQQVWNHDFLWQSMSPNGGDKPNGEISQLIEQDFGDVGRFHEEFKDKAGSHFGSGWTWLVDDGGKLKVISSVNAETPFGTHLQPLLVLDVWEHAYYVDYRNDRKKYIDVFLAKLLNWDFVAANLARSRKSEAA
jgi:superoxide dismutase, Fe-Mn family